MKSLSRIALAAVTSALALGLLTAPVAAADKMDVRVINTPAEAVPVTGSVAITNNPTVSVAGTPTVHVINDGTSPVVVRSASEPTLGPVERQLAPFLNVGTHTDWDDYTVPPGKTLVVEHVSVWLISEGTPVTEQGVLVRVGYVIPEEVNSPDWLLRGPIYLPLSPAGAWGSNGSHYIANQPIRAYVPPGHTLRAILSLRGTASSIITAHVTVIGHLVDAPQ